MNTLVADGTTVSINHCTLVGCFQPVRLLDLVSGWPSSYLCKSSHCSHPSAHGLGTEAFNAYFDGEQSSTPAFFFAKIQDLCVLRLLPLIGLLTPCHPWYCQLDDNELLPCFGPRYDVWSYGRLDHILENKSLSPGQLPCSCQ